MVTKSNLFNVETRIQAIPAQDWNSLLGPDSTPFVHHAFLSLLEESACVCEKTGWQPNHITLRDQDTNQLMAALPLYIKSHSYGEYVFDWAWAEAYAQHGLHYFPKALSAIPFTPVQGGRLLASTLENKKRLMEVLKSWVIEKNYSSAHILFPPNDDIEHLEKNGFMTRNSIQFHWRNQNYHHFDDFLSSLNMKRRKNIKRERRIVDDAGITFEHIPGSSASETDWLFFYQCYANTYFEHGSPPYLNQLFFQGWGQAMPDYLHLIVAQKNQQRIAASLLVVDRKQSTVYGRYWGCIESIPCLHFETAYYQAIEYCIQEKIQVFEGGAQGQHKMARGFLPVTVQSAHYIQDPSFSLAIQRFLEREKNGIGHYLDELAEHSPLKSKPSS
ncbi:MAG: N-acetyltransferase [Polynucleobacter sp.]|nr:N-acetyltransferase [Polynucleobacter sp.]